VSILDRDRLISAVGPWTSNCLIFDRLDSTHLCAKRLMEQLDTEDIPLSPTLILADRQSGGQGRAQRKWSSQPGGLYLNLVWAMTDPSHIAHLPILAAATVHRAVCAVGVENAGIKWPNDILVDGHKLGGILVHARHGARLLATVGLGINVVEAPDLNGLPQQSVTSLADCLGPGNATDRTLTLITSFLEHFTESLHDPQWAIDHWKAHLIHSEGENISLQTSSGAVISGTFEGVNSSGHLMIQTESGLQTLTGGDIVEDDS